MTKQKINNRFGCNEKCLFYLITCNKYLEQCAVQIVNGIRHRWNNYKDNARKFERGEHCMHIHLYEHFNLPSHSGFLKDASLQKK